jgi:chorismate dehydratase
LEKIKVGIVNYLNTRPLLYGIRRSPVMDRMELVQDYPAQVARLLTAGEIDMGLVPVTVLQHLPQHHIYTDYCIGCKGPVASVCLFSEVPVEQIKEVLLDYQSRTSVSLAKILLREYWKINPILTDTNSDFRSSVRGTTAGVIIGDRALEQRQHSPFIYDLGEAWKNFTGLPFVFAAWISNKKLPPDFVNAFNTANQTGLNHITEVVAENPNAVFDLKEYYTKYIDYRLDAEKRKALQLFLDKLAIQVPL